jgi:hypothetical protein
MAETLHARAGETLAGADEESPEAQQHRKRGAKLAKQQELARAKERELDDFDRDLRAADGASPASSSSSSSSSERVAPAARSPPEVKDLQLGLGAVWAGAMGQSQKMARQTRYKRVEEVMAQEFGQDWEGMDARDQRERKRIADEDYRAAVAKKSREVAMGM